MSEKNYQSYYRVDGDVSDVSLEPDGAQWLPGSWSDTAHFSGCFRQRFTNFKIFGGVEDCVDLNNGCNGLTLENFALTSGGKYCITLKGGSNDNLFTGLYIKKHGKEVDIEIGNWSDQSHNFSKRNSFWNVHAEDKKPVTYCYRYGCKPSFILSDVKHLWWRSIGITIYWWVKYAIKSLKP